jgi:hypothetical protein
VREAERSVAGRGASEWGSGGGSDFTGGGGDLAGEAVVATRSTEKEIRDKGFLFIYFY